jgi:hypothetical protein
VDVIQSRSSLKLSCSAFRLGCRLLSFLRILDGAVSYAKSQICDRAELCVQRLIKEKMNDMAKTRGTQRSCEKPRRLIRL